MPKITDVFYFIFKITPVTAQYIICFLAISHSNLICGCLDIKPGRDTTLIILLEAIKIANDANRVRSGKTKSILMMSANTSNSVWAHSLLQSYRIKHVYFTKDGPH